LVEENYLEGGKKHKRETGRVKKREDIRIYGKGGKKKGERGLTCEPLGGDLRVFLSYNGGRKKGKES